MDDSTATISANLKIPSDLLVAWKSGGVEPSATFKFPKLKVEVKVSANAGIADPKARTVASRRTLRDMKSLMNFFLH